MARSLENDMRNRIGLKLAGASLGLSLLVSAPALADKARKGAEDFGDQYITVPNAKHPGKKITGLVRSGPHGDQVRLPDGTWVLCAVTCAVTLRQNSYDLWERRERYRWWAAGRPG
jgi:hypothetical protein